ncbi:MAG: uracil-DNA glycosylase [Phycisphaerae bacterium]
MTTGRELRAALAQQLEGDRWLGITTVPMQPPPPPPRRSSPTPRPHAKPRPPAGTPAARPTPKDDPDAAERAARLARLNRDKVTDCTNCPLSQTRTQTVFGQGSASTRLVFVGEAPGRDEDQQGVAFVGRAGQLLTRMIAAMGLARDDVFICNVLKCRPPDNRDPAADEILACSPYLYEQLAIIAPEVIVALGAPAAKTLLRTSASIGKLRGRFHDFYVSGSDGIGDATPLMPTYHPAYLLRSPGEKVKSWADLKMVMALLGLDGAQG